jgi:6-phosphogluconolactonase (cycloisomerase 2 family)
MKKSLRLGAAATVTLAAGLSLAPPADAAVHGHHGRQGGSHGVFVATDGIAGNHVVAYRRATDGSLTRERTYATGGTGGALTGAVVDRTASEGALSYDAVHHLLLAVNAGSNDLSVFSVHGTTLRLRQVVSSRGTFPVSVATHGNAAYVLNARDGGSVQGYTITHGRLHPVRTWHRQLGLDATAAPEFTHTPGQVGFTPSGHQLVVTTKAASNAIDVFRLDRRGALSSNAVVNVKEGSVPFGFTFDPAGHLAVTETGIGALTTYAVRPDGTLRQLSSGATGQAATCWVTGAGRFLFTSNAGSATESGFSTARDGAVALLGQTSTDGGTVDADATPDGAYLYVQTGAAGIVDGFRVGADGSLAPVGSVTVPDAVGAEGIVAL